MRVKHIFFTFSIAAGILLVAFMPMIVFGQPFTQSGIVPCDGADCDFNSLIELANNIIKWMVFIAPFLAGIAFAFAGFYYFTSAGNPQRVKQAHEIFQYTFLGIVIVVAAWLIVKTILLGLSADAYLLEYFN